MIERGELILREALGKTISAIKLDTIQHSDALCLTFTDNHHITIEDDGQSCCEHRYMSTDDDLDYYVGAQLLGMDVKDGPDIGDEYDYHEQQFLEITTSKGVFTLVTHNEHNGYYGGFNIVVYGG